MSHHQSNSYYKSHGVETRVMGHYQIQQSQSKLRFTIRVSKDSIRVEYQLSHMDNIHETPSDKRVTQTEIDNIQYKV